MIHIPHNRPCVDKEEIAAVTGVLREGWLIAGGEVTTFEKNFAKYIGARYAIAVNSGTSALHLSLLALGVQKNDEIILPTYTASDLLNAINYVDAIPILVDTAKNSCNIDIKKIPEKITKRTKVMIIPHTFGFPTDIPSLSQYKIPIIEDCAQTVGSMLHNKRVGIFGSTSIFSFFASKLLTTGQGGMVVTSDKRVYEFVKDTIDYNGRDNYIVRYNYPLTDIAASIGNVQLKKYQYFSTRRKYIALRYQEVLEKKCISHFPTSKDINVVPFRFLLYLSGGKEVEKIKTIFLKNGIEVKQPIASHELLHRLLQEDSKHFQNAEEFSRKVISLPMYPCLTNEDIDQIVTVLTNYL